MAIDQSTEISEQLKPKPQPLPAESEQGSAEDLLHRGFTIRGLLQSFGSCGISIVVHMVLFLLLAIFGFATVEPQEVKEIVSEQYEQIVEEEDLKVELQENIEVATEMAMHVVANTPSVGEPGAAGGAVSSPKMMTEMLKSLDGPTIEVGPPQMFMPASTSLIGEVPEGTLGEERVIVDNYDQALSRITKEIVWMLEKNDVLVVWCFDMSESMKDDQQEIRDRIYQVYSELGIIGKGQDDRLATAVTSYGAERFDLTQKKPTSDLNKIREAIDSIPIDPSGKEVMCQAVGYSIHQYVDYAKRTKRQMALVLVTDESGDRENNDGFLEKAIAEARAAKCRIYALGREAAFGYPHARMRWRHPQTNRVHWLLVDRGPETAFPEQLQTNGFHRRWDYFSSGFGPYEQARMAKETNGIFFMLPSVETDAVHAVKRRYELEAMRSYKPDLRAKVEVLQDRDNQERYPLRWFLWTVVHDLNPLASREKARMLEMDMNFPLDRGQFIQQVNAAQVKARAYLNYLGAAEKVLVENKRHREQEVSPRWQANYDLMLAQLAAYQVRIHEYGVYLEWVKRNPLPIPERTKVLENGNIIYLVDWNVGGRKKTFAEEEGAEIPYEARDHVLSYIQRATDLFQFVIDEHPGTPWAERAKYEMRRGYGVHMVPDYDLPIKQVSNPSPVPKL